MSAMNVFLSAAFQGMAITIVADNAAGSSSACNYCTASNNDDSCRLSGHSLPVASLAPPTRPRRKRSIVSTPPQENNIKFQDRWQPVSSDDDLDDDETPSRRKIAVPRSNSNKSRVVVTNEPVAMNNSYPEEFARARQSRRRTDVAASQPVRKNSDNTAPTTVRTSVEQRRRNNSKTCPLAGVHPRKRTTTSNQDFTSMMSRMNDSFQRLNTVNESSCYGTSSPSSMQRQLEMVLNQAMAITATVH